MFNSARNRMPAVDYVSIVESAYKDQRAMLFGAFASALALAASAWRNDSTALWLVGLALIGAALARYWNMSEFWKAKVAPTDADAAQYWEWRATIGGVLVATTYGIWCLVSVVFVDDAFAELSSISLSIAAMVGLVARNFGLDRLLTLQGSILSGCMAASLLLGGDLEHLVLAGLLIIMMISYRKLAGDVRDLLLRAVHGRVEAMRLASELDTALATMSHGLCLLDERGSISVVNMALQDAFLGHTDEDFVGRPVGHLISAAQRNGRLTAEASARLTADLNAGSNDKILVELTDNRMFEITMTSRQGYTVILFEDISERLRDHQRITHMARFDALTQLSNRAYFSEQVQAQLSAPHANARSMMMIVDLDDFKHINDTMGHLVGDALLIEVSYRIRQVFGEDAILGRFGGDEFTIFKYGAFTQKDAEDSARAVIALMAVPFELGGETIHITTSVGMVIEEEDITLAEMLTRADLALYEAKGTGKSRWCQFEDQMDADYRQRQLLRNDLQEAVDKEQLYLHFQPIIDLKTHKITGCEALVRWNHPEQGPIPPNVFIPLAEESGLICEISKFVLEKAATTCLAWPEDMSVSVNLSARDFMSEDVPEMVANVIKRTGLAPERLMIEVTETALIAEKDKAATALSLLRESGVAVALDDFGTGYSSMSYLNAMPFSRLKIDRAFVIDLVESRRAQKLLRNLASLASDLDMSVTVEGVETQEQLEILSATPGIGYAQGYLFGAPLGEREISELITRWRGGDMPAGLQIKTRARG